MIRKSRRFNQKRNTTTYAEGNPELIFESQDHSVCTAFMERENIVSTNTLSAKKIFGTVFLILRGGLI